MILLSSMLPALIYAQRILVSEHAMRCFIPYFMNYAGNTDSQGV